MARDSFPLDKMFPGAVAQYRWAKGDFDSGGDGGDMYGLPSDAQSQIIAYNKKMFDDAGVAYPTDDWTWDDLVEMGKKITNADENKWGMQIDQPLDLHQGQLPLLGRRRQPQRRLQESPWWMRPSRSKPGSGTGT